MAIFLYENNYSFTFWTVDTWRTFHCAHLRPRLVWSLYSPGNHERSLRGDLIQLLKFIKGINELSWVNPPAARCTDPNLLRVSKGMEEFPVSSQLNVFRELKSPKQPQFICFKNRYDVFKPAVKHPLSTTP